MIAYQDITYFVELTNTLNFSRAAERCGITQPSLSAAIKRLEQFVGTELFIRDKHKVLLTQSGKNLLAHSKQLLDYWSDLKSSCLNSINKVHGSITLGCHLSVALYTLPTILSKLLTSYPQLDIRLKHDLSRKITEEIINFSVDIGIVVNPIRHPDLVIKKLFTDEVACWHAKDLEISPEQETIIICDQELHQTQWILKKINTIGIKQYRIIHISTLELIASLTAKGLGIGILPANVMKAVDPTVKLLKHSPVFNDEVCLVYRHENKNIRAVKEVAARIREMAI